MHSPRNMPPSMNMPQMPGQSGMPSPRGLPPSGYHTPRESPHRVIQQASPHSTIYGYQQPLNQVTSLSPRHHYPLNQPPHQHVISHYSPQQQQQRLCALLTSPVYITKFLTIHTRTTGHDPCGKIWKDNRHPFRLVSTV